ncbi:hypothetical protein D9M68_627710 [compost metagenome]
MNKPVKHYLGDKDVQLILGTLLRVGVVLSTAIVLLGGIIYLSSNSGKAIKFNEFNPAGTPFSSIVDIFTGLRHFDGLAIIQFGVLLLIFTPIARVVFSIFSFLMERDYMYVVVGIIVLCIIVTSLYLDIAH